MNILFVAHEERLNGASLSLIGIIDELIQDNKIYVLTNRKEGKFLEELKKRNIIIIHSKYRWWRIEKNKNKFRWTARRIYRGLQISGINLFSAIKLKNKMKSEKIDIIHSNTSVVNIGAIIASFCNIPHVWHIREFGMEDQNLEFIYSRKYSLKYMKKHSEYIIAISKAVYNKYNKDLKCDKFGVIYNGVSLKNIQKKEFIENDNGLKLIICGALTNGKGQKDAILAINELMKRGHKKLDLRIAGSGTNDNVESIKTLIKRLNLQSNIELLGRVDNLIDIRKNTDIELVCSRCEAFGRVTIEAMMSMMPVIGANTGGTTELIKDGYNGFLYNQGNYIDLADKIEMFLKDRNKIETMGKNAQEFAQNFTSSLNAKKIYDIYEKTI